MKKPKRNPDQPSSQGSSFSANEQSPEKDPGMHSTSFGKMNKPQEMALLMKYTEESFVLVDTELKVITFNEQFQSLYLQYFGRKVRQGDSILDYAQPHRKQKAAQIYQQVFAGETASSEIEVPLPDQSVRVFSVKFKPAYDEQGCLLGAFVSTTDISEQKQKETLLKESEARLNHAQKIANMGNWDHDLKHDILYWSDQIYTIFGIQKEAFGANYEAFFNAIHPEDREAFSIHQQNAMEGKSKLDIVHRVLLPDGTVRYVHEKGELLYDEDGNPAWMCGSVQDVTALKKAEHKLQEERNMLRAIIDNLPDHIFVKDKERRQIINNKKLYTEIFGTETEEESIGKTIFEHQAPEVSQRFDQDDRRVLETGESIINREEFTFDKEGNKHWLLTTKVPLRDHNDEIVGLVGMSRDITESKKAMGDKERLLDVLQRSLNEIYIFHPDTLRFEYVNEGALRNIGYSMEEMSTMTPLDIKPEYNMKKFRKLIAPLLERKKEKVIFETIHKRADGSLYPVEVHLQYVSQAEHPVFIAVILDITERKSNEKKLKKLNEQNKRRAEELANSNKELEQFAYIASHDLQEPLRMVTSFLTQLENKYKEQLDDRAKQYIYFATDGAARMRRIILDLLEYSRAGRRDYILEEIDMNELVDEVIRLNQTAIEENNAVVKRESLPLIKGARTPLQQVLHNLIGNAIKYQKEGVSPVIEVGAREADKYWEFTVSDNGIGINPQFYDKIFILFQRLHNRQQYSGTGIGLSICKKIIENLQGKLWVTSIPEQGSTFYFTIKKFA